MVTEFYNVLTTQLFMQHALLGGVLASLICGLVGPFVVVRKITYIAGGIAHSIVGGMGLAYYIGADPMIGAFVTSILVSLVLSFVSINFKEKEDSIISALWSIGMATGILFLSQTPQYNVDFMSYLFGNILMITQKEIMMMFSFGAVVIGLLLFFHRQLVAISFDESYARLRGLSITFYTVLLYIIIALTVVMLIRVVGLILVIALLAMPVMIAELLSRSFKKIILFSVFINVLTTVGGLVFAYYKDIPVGSTIVIVVASLYLVSLLGSRLIKF